MVAGEFAVLEPGYSLVVMAADRYVYTSIEATAENKLSLTDFGLHELSWTYDNKIVHVQSEDERTGFVKAAMRFTLAYLEELQVNVTPFSLSIKSELNDETGIKYGLGSSAAVVTSVVTAILQQFLNSQPTKELVFKLASMAHVCVQGNGSCADIAASTYGGVLHYRAFQADWLLEAIAREKKVAQIVEMDWPYVLIEELAFPTSLTVCVGWTGAPASTGSLVKEIRQLKITDKTSYEAFLKASEQAVEWILSGMKQNDVREFLIGIEANRMALAELGMQANVAIETPRLYELSKVASDLEGAGKLSGAGGGDCGIAFVDSMLKVGMLVEGWIEKGIKPLKLKVSLDGSAEE